MRRCQMSLKGSRALAVPRRFPGPVCLPFLCSTTTNLRQIHGGETQRRGGEGGRVEGHLSTCLDLRALHKCYPVKKRRLLCRSNRKHQQIRRGVHMQKRPHEVSLVGQHCSRLFALAAGCFISLVTNPQNPEPLHSAFVSSQGHSGEFSLVISVSLESKVDLSEYVPCRTRLYPFIAPARQQAKQLMQQQPRVSQQRTSKVRHTTKQG